MPCTLSTYRYLLLARNQLYNGSPQPWLLPNGWVRPDYPVAFPMLNQLVLYPGNDNLCFLPSCDDYKPTGFDELNPGACGG